MSSLHEQNENFVELFWIKNTGDRIVSLWPKRTAELFLSKHLIPQKEKGLISDAGINDKGIF